MASQPQNHQDLLTRLNKAQRRAVTSESDTVAILAGPGSGKTHTLTSRVVWMIQNCGYQPSGVIVATFTVKAAREMKERIGKILGQDVQKKIILGTFHSIARRYLVFYGKHIGIDPKFDIIDETEGKAILKRIIERHDFKLDPVMTKGWISKKKSKGSMGNEPPKTFPNGQPIKENPNLQHCYQLYQEHLRISNLLDFDDLLVKGVELLQNYPICVKNVQAVLVDEYQDTNGIQYDLMKLLAQHQRRITIVGDPDQSIYGWRSAEIENLHRMLREFPGTEEIPLEENYRSSQSILSVSLGVIQQDGSRYQKVLLPIHGKGTKPVLRRLRDAAIEGDWIVLEIKRAIRMFGGMLELKDCAILLRTAASSRHVETALGRRGVAYRMIGGRKFYERLEIKILVDYLRAIQQPNNNDVMARIINVPKRGVGEKTIKAIVEGAEVAKKSLWQLLVDQCNHTRFVPQITTAMENKLRSGLIHIIGTLGEQSRDAGPGSAQSLVDLIQQLIKKLDYENFLKDKFPKDHEGRWATVQEFINLAADFAMECEGLDEEELPEVEEAEQEKENGILGRFLANISLASDAQKDKEGNETDVVTICTIHAAKGLEWPVVFVPCVYNGSIPHSRSEDWDEERRLLYVAMTRAKSLLYLSCSDETTFGRKAAELSPFISELGITAFADRGPSFDRCVVENVAKTLGRSAPSEKTIYDNLPLNMSTEDDVYYYSADSFSQGRRYDFGDGLSSSSGGSSSYKRQRFGNQEGSSSNAAPSWTPGFSTTTQNMSEQAEDYPGFIILGSHPVVKAAAETAGKGRASAAALSSKTAYGKRSSGQQHGEMRGRRWTQGNGFQHSGSEAVVRKPYAHFSSSPVRPTTSPLKRTKQQQQQVVPPGAPAVGRRAASSVTAAGRGKLAASSATAAGKGKIVSGGSVRRPAAAGGRRQTTDRVRKPFKPLTVNRKS